MLSPSHRLIKIIGFFCPFFILLSLQALDIYSYTEVGGFAVTERVQNCAHGLQMVSADEGWAGSCGNSYSILHFHQGQMTWETTPNIVLFSMNVQDGWGVQEDLKAFPGHHLFHYQHGHWIDGHMDFGSGVDDIQSVAPNSAWVITNSGALWHYDGVSWQLTSLPSLVRYSDGISMTSPTDGWVWDENHLWHYASGQWIDFSYPKDAAIVDVSSISNDIWMIGYHTIPYHYDAQRQQWNKVDLPGLSASIASTSYGFLSLSDGQNGWLTSYYLPDTNIGRSESYKSWQLANGQFIEAHSPFQLTTMHMVAPDDGWGMAQKGSSGLNSESILMHYNHGTWHTTLIPRLPLSLGVLAARIGILLLLAGFIYFTCWLLINVTIDPLIGNRRWSVQMICICSIVVSVILAVNALDPFIFSEFNPILLRNLRLAAYGLCMITFIPMLATFFMRD
jgi:hypothetical protein